MKKSLVPIAFILGMTGLALILGSLVNRVGAQKPAVVNITFYNPYRVNIQVKLACDWDGKKFSFKDSFMLRKKSSHTLNLPKTAHNCRLLPTVK